MGTGNSALFEVSSNSTCCKFFCVHYLSNTSQPLHSLFGGGGVWRVTVPQECCETSPRFYGCSWGGFAFVGSQQAQTLSISKGTHVAASGLSEAVGEMPALMVLWTFCFCNFLWFGVLSAQLSFVPIAGGRVTSPKYKTHSHKKKRKCLKNCNDMVVLVACEFLKRNVPRQRKLSQDTIFCKQPLYPPKRLLGRTEHQWATCPVQSHFFHS